MLVFLRLLVQLAKFHQYIGATMPRLFSLLEGAKIETHVF
jgi:hypothetical protein